MFNTITERNFYMLPENLQAIMNALTSFATTFALKLIGALIVLIIGINLSKWIVKKIFGAKSTKKVDTTVQHFLQNVIKVILYVVVIISAAGILGIPATSFLTLLATAGVAVGLALQGSLSNIAGSIMLMLFRPFKVGDFVECAGVSGVVEDINLFYTIITSGDNKRIVCPNSTVSNGVITNYSAKDTRRVDITFSVSYGSDIEKVKSIILKTVSENPLVLTDPQPFVGLVTHNASSIDFVCRSWVNTADYWTVYFSLMENVKCAFDENDIPIPFPQMDVHIKNDD